MIQQIEACHNIMGIPQVRSLFPFPVLSVSDVGTCCFLYCLVKFGSQSRELYMGYDKIMTCLVICIICFQDMAIDMTGQMNPPQRADEWQSRRVFYVTPQCLERDIQSGAATLISKLNIVVPLA